MAAPLHEFLSTWKSLKNDDFSHKHDLLKQIMVEKQILTSKEGQAVIVSQINQLLSSIQTRLNGLVLLIHFMEQIQPDIFKRHILSWLDQLCTIQQQHQPDHIYQLTCRTLSVLIQFVARYPEQSHQASTGAVPNLYHILLQASQSWQLEAVQCLLSCLKNFPGPAGPIKEKLMRFLIPHFTSEQSDLVEVSIDCYCKLPSTGGAGHLGIKHTETWNGQFDRVLSSIDALLNTAYADLEDEEDREEQKSESLTWLSDVGEDLHLLVQRYKLACRCAQRMLTSPVSYQRTIRVSAIIRTITRCLSVNARMLESRPSTSRLRLAAVVSPLHQATFSLLDGLITCCGTNLLPHASSVSKMFLQTLSWTNQTSGSGRRQCCGLRVSVYRSMITWFDHVTHGLGVDDLATEMMVDIRPESSGIKLGSKMQSMTELMDTKKKGKGRKKINMSGGKEASPTEHNPNYSCVCASLEAFQSMINASCHKLKISTLADVQDLLVRTLLDSQSDQKTPPYNDVQCRYLLYALMRSLMSARHGKWAPTLHVYIRIFSAGRREKDDEIRRLCSGALMTCTAAIHPRYPAVHATPSGDCRSNSGLPQHSSMEVPSLFPRPAAGDFSSLLPGVTIDSTADETTTRGSSTVTQQETVTVRSEGGDVGVATTIVEESTDESDDDSVDELTHQIDDLVAEKASEEVPPVPRGRGEGPAPVGEESPRSSASRAVKRPAGTPDCQLQTKVRMVSSDVADGGSENIDSECGNDDNLSGEGKAVDDKDSEVDSMLLSFQDVGPDSNSDD